MENYAAALDEILRLKPSAAKGRYIKKATVVDHDGPGHPAGRQRHPQPDLGARRVLINAGRGRSRIGEGALFACLECEIERSG